MDDLSHLVPNLGISQEGTTAVEDVPQVAFQGGRRTPNALMFAFYFPPCIESGARRPFRFVRYLQQFGYITHVITAKPTSQDLVWTHVSAAPAAIPSRKAMIGSRAAAMLQRLLPYNDQLPWVAHAVGEAEKVIARNRPSVLLSTSPPVATHLAAWIVSRRYRIPWIADFRDPLYGNPSRSRKWGWIWDMPLERLLISDAAAVIANTDTAAEMLKQRYPVHRDKIHIIWNGYDPEEALSARPIPTRRYRLMVHAGSLYDQRHPSLLLATLDRLIARRALDSEKIRLRLIGEFYRNDPWVQQSKFEDLIRIGCVEHSHGAVPAAEAIREMTEADFLLLLDLHHRGRGIQVPAKIFEYIQIGRPILVYTNRNSPVERILANSGIRHVCIYPESSAEEMDAAVLRFLEAPSTADRASEWFRQQFDGRAQTGTLAAILNAVSV